jgi:hypothetical protein
LVAKLQPPVQQVLLVAVLIVTLVEQYILQHFLTVTEYVAAATLNIPVVLV